MLLENIVLALVIDVDVSTLDISKTCFTKLVLVFFVVLVGLEELRRLTFELSLQSLRDVVGDFERLVLAHDNVDLDVVLLSSVVRTAGIDLLNPRVVRNNQVNQLADEFCGR